MFANIVIHPPTLVGCHPFVHVGCELPASNTSGWGGNHGASWGVTLIFHPFLLIKIYLSKMIISATSLASDPRHSGQTGWQLSPPPRRRWTQLYLPFTQRHPSCPCHQTTQVHVTREIGSFLTFFITIIYLLPALYTYGIIIIIIRGKSEQKVDTRERYTANV